MKLLSVKTLSAPVIAGIVVGVAFVMLFALNFKATPLRLHPSDEPLIVIIPEGASLASSGKTFTPQKVRVVVNTKDTCCPYVKWVNRDKVTAIIEADNESDPDFYNATKDFVFIMPGGSFEYKFTKPGEFGYHGRPWQHGTVEVLEQFS